MIHIQRKFLFEITKSAANIRIIMFKSKTTTPFNVIDNNQINCTVKKANNALRLKKQFFEINKSWSLMLVSKNAHCLYFAWRHWSPKSTIKVENLTLNALKIIEIRLKPRSTIKVENLSLKALEIIEIRLKPTNGVVPLAMFYLHAERYDTSLR